MTSFVCLSAVPVKAKTGVPEKMKKRNQFYSLCTYQCQVGTGHGIGQGFDIFQKIAVKFPTPGRNVRSNITEIPHPGK